MAHPEAEARDGTQRRVYAVGALLQGLGRLLEDQVGRLWVVGEISDLNEARSGHVYFSLKDADGVIRAALFRSAARRVPFELEDGMEVLVFADVSIYAARGDLQLVVREVEPRGQGALQLAVEQLRRRLEAEGFFDEARKRELPSVPRRVGVVTSPSGAAIRDVIEMAAQRFPATPLLLAPTRVQGDGAAGEIVRALRRVVEAPGRDDVDVVLLVRGGGSLEDLMSFNSEAVVRAIRACPVPVVCGVGHEVDVTLSDLAADLRAPTPSGAAVAVLPDREALATVVARDVARLRRAALELLTERRRRVARERDALRVLAPTARLAAQRQRLETSARSLAREARALVDSRRQRVEVASRGLLPDARALLASRRQRFEGAARRLGPAARALAGARAGRLGTASARLDSLSPLAVLGRGYALVRRESDDRIVRGPEEVAAGDALRVRLARGELRAVAIDPDPEKSS